MGETPDVVGIINRDLTVRQAHALLLKLIDKMKPVFLFDKYDLASIKDKLSDNGWVSVYGAAYLPNNPDLNKAGGAVSIQLKGKRSCNALSIYVDLPSKFMATDRDYKAAEKNCAYLIKCADIMQDAIKPDYISVDFIAFNKISLNTNLPLELPWLLQTFEVNILRQINDSIGRNHDSDISEVYKFENKGGVYKIVFEGTIDGYTAGKGPFWMERSAKFNKIVREL